MVQKIETVKEIAGFLNNDTYTDVLDNMLESLNSNECIVSIMGQFSAGKSRLINNLLGKTILPVHITETTAFVTLIKYGEEDYAEVTYVDGKEEKISIEDSLALWQSGDSDKVSNIEGITIYMKNDMLEKGLIFADTPGINTIINKHIELTTKILDRSDIVFYVNGKSVTNEDIKFIEKIRAAGIETMFIRTHMDAVNADEESLDEVISKEKEILSELTEHELFFVSNEKESPFYENIDNVRNYLYKTLTADVKAVLEKSCNLKLSNICSMLLEELSHQQKCFEQLAEGKLTEYNSEKEKINIALENLNKQINKRTERSKDNCAAAEKDAQKYAMSIVEKAKSKFEKQLDKIDIGSDVAVYEDTIKEMVSEDYQKIQNTYRDILERIIGETRNEITEILSSDLPDYDLGSFVPSSISETQEQLRMLELAEKESGAVKEEIVQHDHNIESLQNENTEIDRERALDSARSMSIKKELENFPAYEAQHIIVQEASNTGSLWGARIGNILDWATILIPGKAYVTVAAKGASGAAKILANCGAKTVKAVNTLNKVSKTMAKGKKAANIAQNVDHVLDFTKGVKNVFREQDDSSPVKILDYLTFEHYFKKIGSRFDKKEIYQTDREYEKKYNEEKAAIEKRMNESVQAELDKRSAINKNLTEIRRQEMQKNMLKAKQVEIESELKKLKRKIEKEKKKSIHLQMCNYYANMGANMLSDLYGEIRDKVHENLPSLVEKYIAADNIIIMQRVAEQKQKLTSLEDAFNDISSEQIQLRSQTYQTYAAWLRENIID